MYIITMNYIINIIVHVLLRPQQSQLCARDGENSIVRVLYVHTYRLYYCIYTYSQPGGDSIWKCQSILTNILGKKPQKSNIYFSMNKHLHNYTHIKSIKPTIWIIWIPSNHREIPWFSAIFSRSHPFGSCLEGLPWQAFKSMRSEEHQRTAALTWSLATKSDGKNHHLW